MFRIPLAAMAVVLAIAGAAQGQVAAPLLDPTAAQGSDIGNPATVAWTRTRVSAGTGGITLVGDLVGSTYTDPAYVPCPFGLGNCAPGPDGFARFIHARLVGETFSAYAERTWLVPDPDTFAPVPRAQADQIGVAGQLATVFSLGYASGKVHVGDIVAIAAPGAGTYPGEVRFVGMTLRLQERWYLGYNQRDDEASTARIVGIAYATEFLHLEYLQEQLKSGLGGRRKLVLEGARDKLIFGFDRTESDIDLIDDISSWSWYLGLAYENSWSYAFAGGRVSILAPALATDYDEKNLSFRIGYTF